MDDILIIRPDENLINEIKTYLDVALTIKDLGLTRYFLGMEITRGLSSTSLNQSKYILDLLKSTGLHGCRSMITSIP